MTASFSSLGLILPLQRALADRSYVHPTPIQIGAIPHLLTGRDLLGVAQTGTGKTAAFALPILQYLAENPARPAPRAPRALILTPTRELASQVEDSFVEYGRHLTLRTLVVYGGVGLVPQARGLRGGIDVLVATPGRLLDLMGQGHADLSAVELFVLDEADRMLDMGFLADVRKIIARLPKDRQSILFSATMPTDIVKLAGTILRDPVRVEVTPPATTTERVEQFVYFVPKNAKRDLLTLLLEDGSIERTLVFTRTKHGADRVVKHLRKLGEPADAIHSDKSQAQRERALDAFRDGRTRVLIATDIAARGIDVPGITHVFNFDLPNVSESYVHRIGRTARAGRDGIAISFCDHDERSYLRDIETLTRVRLKVVTTPDLSQVESGAASNRVATRVAPPTMSGSSKVISQDRSNDQERPAAAERPRAEAVRPEREPRTPRVPADQRHQRNWQDKAPVGRPPARERTGPQPGPQQRTGPQQRPGTPDRAPSQQDRPSDQRERPTQDPRSGGPKRSGPARGGSSGPARRPAKRSGMVRPGTASSSSRSSRGRSSGQRR